METGIYIKYDKCTTQLAVQTSRYARIVFEWKPGISRIWRESERDFSQATSRKTVLKKDREIVIYRVPERGPPNSRDFSQASEKMRLKLLSGLNQHLPTVLNKLCSM